MLGFPERHFLRVNCIPIQTQNGIIGTFARISDNLSLLLNRPGCLDLCGFNPPHLYRLDNRLGPVPDDRKPGVFSCSHRVSLVIIADSRLIDTFPSFIFLYSPAYNVAYNALTYSGFH